jgi:hypothetical protein
LHSPPANPHMRSRSASVSIVDSVSILARESGPSVPVQGATAVGVDDWAWRKGQRYGTILVNLETHAPPLTYCRIVVPIASRHGCNPIPARR